MNKRVLVGMSGGVDSSVAALLLKEQGFTVAGLTLRLHDESLVNSESAQKCGSEKDIEDAKAVCKKLGIEHFVQEYKTDFKANVIDRFINEYLLGSTPNPCIDCNRFIKFPKLLEFAKLHGYDYIATGHYAKKVFLEKEGRYTLTAPHDTSKEQTYVLYSLSQEILEHLLLPLCDMTKAEIREVAEKNGLSNSQKKDSQDICFVPDKDYAAFIKKYTAAKFKKGDYLDVFGNKIGTHDGVIHYTVGQRKGLGIALGKPQFVISKNAENNTVVLGDEEHLFSKTMIVKDVNFTALENLTEKMECQIKIRYRQLAVDGTLYPNDDGTVLVEFKEPQRAATRGQAAVFYLDGMLLGGGTIF